MSNIIKEWKATFDNKEVKVVYSKIGNGYTLDKYTTTKYGEISENLYWCRNSKKGELNSQKKAKAHINNVFMFNLVADTYNIEERQILLEKLGYDPEDYFFERFSINYNVINELFSTNIDIYSRKTRERKHIWLVDIIYNDKAHYLENLIETVTGQALFRDYVKMMEKK